MSPTRPSHRQRPLIAGTLLGTLLLAQRCRPVPRASRASTSTTAAKPARSTCTAIAAAIRRRRPGNEYAIRIRNCSDRRVLAVVSVDGVNVVTGETAAPEQSGYVIEPYGYVTIEGWRKSLERTAAFYFSDPGDAYATRTGRPDDLGVIGVALFRERERAWAQSPEAVSRAAVPRERSPRRCEGPPPWRPCQRAGAARYRPRTPGMVAGAPRRIRACEFAPDQRVVIRLRPLREPPGTGHPAAAFATLARAGPVSRQRRFVPDP